MDPETVLDIIKNKKIVYIPFFLNIHVVLNVLRLNII